MDESHLLCMLFKASESTSVFDLNLDLYCQAEGFVCDRLLQMAAPISSVFLLRMPESSSTSGTQKNFSSLYAKPRSETKTTLSPYRIETSPSLVLSQIIGKPIKH